MDVAVVELIIGQVVGAVIAVLIARFYHRKAAQQSAIQLAEQQRDFERMMAKASDDLFQVTTALTHLQVFVLRALTPGATLKVSLDDDGMPAYYQLRDDHGGMTAGVDQTVPWFITRGRPMSGPIDPDDLERIVAEQKRNADL